MALTGLIEFFIFISLYFISIHCNNYTCTYGVVFCFIGTRTVVRVTNMFEKAEYKKPILQGLIYRVLLYIETSGDVFFIAHGPVTICIPIGTIGYCIYFTIKGDV